VRQMLVFRFEGFTCPSLYRFFTLLGDLHGDLSHPDMTLGDECAGWTWLFSALVSRSFTLRFLTYKIQGLV